MKAPPSTRDSNPGNPGQYPQTPFSFLGCGTHDASAPRPVARRGRARLAARIERRRRSQVIALSRSSEVVFGHLAVAQNPVEQARADMLA